MSSGLDTFLNFNFGIVEMFLVFITWFDLNFGIVEIVIGFQLYIWMFISELLNISFGFHKRVGPYFRNSWNVIGVNYIFEP